MVQFREDMARDPHGESVSVERGEGGRHEANEDQKFE
jgi:hypothetical protein